jgi:hypothetical protein
LFGKFFLVLLETFEHVVCARGHTVALFCKFFAAGGGHCSFRIVLRLSHIKVGGKISEWQQAVAMLGSPRWDCSEQPAYFSPLMFPSEESQRFLMHRRAHNTRHANWSGRMSPQIH